MYKNILDLKDKFDTFILDAFGVFWTGSNLFENAENVIKTLIDSGKNVYILSNTTQTSVLAENHYTKYGLIKNQHYNEIITAGEFTRSVLLKEELKFKSNPNPLKYFIFGSENKKIFENTKYIEVDNPEDADFIYIGRQIFTEEEYNNLDADMKKYIFEKKKGDKYFYRTSEINPLIPRIKKIMQYNIPFLACNPDYKSSQKVKSGENVFLLTAGSIVKYLQDNNVETIEFGKPHKELFDFTLNIIENKTNKKVDKDRVCMVGDTLRTDIKGANNAGIKSVLCVETGMVAYEMEQKNKTLNELIEEEGVIVDYTIKGFSIP